MDLAKFGYKINVKVKIFKTFIYILGYILEPCIEIWRVLYILVSFWLLKISKKTSGFLHLLDGKPVQSSQIFKNVQFFSPN